MSLKELIKYLIVLIVIFAWIFSGWPPIFNFPQEVRVARAAVSFIAATEAGTGAAAVNLAINVPSGVSDDDLLRLFGVTADGDDGGFDALGGWTEIRDAAVFLTGGSAPSPPGMSVWWRIASSEPASYTITPTFGSTGISAQMLAFSGVDTTTPMDVTDTIATGDGANANAPTIGSGSSTDGYITVIADFFDAETIATQTLPSGYTDPDTQGMICGTGGGNGNCMGSAYRSTAIDPAAAEDPAAFTTAAEQWGAISVAISPIRNTAPNTPTIDEDPTFSNIATGSQPFIGYFNATDPDGDVLEYEINWDTDENFAPPVLASESSAEFASNGFTAATFSSGASVSYVVLASESFTNGKTYYWRVRARDTGGSNTFTAYSSRSSIFVDTVLTVTQWFQSSSFQFGRDTLSNTATSSTGVRLIGW